MWRPPLNFVSIHYAYITTCSILAFLIIYAGGNVPAVDAFFFGCSGNTESGLNTIDVKALKTYQQLVIYFFPIVTNLGFINIAVVIVRIYWFEKRLRQHAPWLLLSNHVSGRSTAPGTHDIEAQAISSGGAPQGSNAPDEAVEHRAPVTPDRDQKETARQDSSRNITWANGLRRPTSEKATQSAVSGRKHGGPTLDEVDEVLSDDAYDDKISAVDQDQSGVRRRRSRRLQSAATSISVDRIASSMFVLGDTQERARSRSRGSSARISRVDSAQLRPRTSMEVQLPVSRRLTRQDRESLGGLEYRALWLLLKMIIGYFIGLHLFGVICLVPWIHTAPAKYTDYLRSQGQDHTWWAIYSAQTMVDNLGFTLTPDSMISFADATWPMLVMTFLAFAGNTCYPIILRLLIWTMTKILPEKNGTQETLRFLLDHPRRCYTLLFPSNVTWILFGILFALNFVDVLLIIVLDLHNAEVTAGLPPGPRVLAALFQAASSRHTGTSTFNLANVNPAVQFSLLVMMYISIFPIAFSIRASNTYGEQAVGKYGGDTTLDDHQKSSSYVLAHARNQLSFDLWYVFLGVFCICIAESDRIADNADPAFSVFAILFEIVSGYGNVGLSLGYPTVMTSLSGKFSTFSKLVICAMMIRGRHRGLPYALDKAIMLPGQDFVDAEEEQGSEKVA